MTATERLEGKASAIAEEKNSASEVRRLSLGDLLKDMTAIDRLIDMPDDAFDAETIAGRIGEEMRRVSELINDPQAGEELRAALRAKVDSIRHVVSEFEAYAARTEIRAKRLHQRIRTARRRADSLMEYVNANMAAAGFDQLVGNEFKIKRIRSATPSVTFDRESGPEDMVQFGDRFVEEIPASYTWNTREVVAALRPFYKAINDQPDCEACRGNGRVIVENEVHDCATCFGTKKQFPKGVEVPDLLWIAKLSFSHRVEFDEADAPNVTPKTRKKK